MQVITRQLHYWLFGHRFSQKDRAGLQEDPAVLCKIKDG